jgi:hypothetical protein
MISSKNGKKATITGSRKSAEFFRRAIPEIHNFFFSINQFLSILYSENHSILVKI